VNSLLAPAVRPARPWVAAVLSVLFPGLGHLYVWQPRSAAIAWICVAAASAVVVLAFVAAPHVSVIGLAIAALAVTYGAAVVHAWRSAQRSRGRERPARSVLLVLLAVVYVGSTIVSSALQRWVQRYVVVGFRIPADSMKPTIIAGDYLFVTPRRRPTLTHEEIVAYQWSDVRYLKRIAGLAGDTLSMRDQRLYRNGVPIEEPYAIHVDSGRPETATWGPVVVPAERVFVMGDNRNASLDSRHMGFIEEHNVIGHALRIYFSRDPETGTIHWSRIGRRLE